MFGIIVDENNVFLVFLIFLVFQVWRSLQVARRSGDSARPEIGEILTKHMAFTNNQPTHYVFLVFLGRLRADVG